MPFERDDAGRALIELGRTLDARGWVPATSGNLSIRLGAGTALVTVSGRHKGRLTGEDFLVLDLDGTPRSPGTPSAETPLHLQLYRLDPGIGCVLHAHPPHATVLTRLHPGDGVVLEGYELLKAFRGVTSHETRREIPILANEQDMALLERALEARWPDADACYAYLIRGHGVYAWGADPDEAFRHLEALEFLLGCELEALRARGGSWEGTP